MFPWGRRVSRIHGARIDAACAYVERGCTSMLTTGARGLSRKKGSHDRQQPRSAHARRCLGGHSAHVPGAGFPHVHALRADRSRLEVPCMRAGVRHQRAPAKPVQVRCGLGKGWRARMKHGAQASFCAVCQLNPARSHLCATCGRAWDRARNKDDGTLAAMMTWTARRAWRFARLAQRTRSRK